MLRELTESDQWRGLTLIGRCAGGESGGVFLVESGTSERWVLKWNQAPVALREWQIAAIDRLRSRGYPIPTHVAVAVGEGTAPSCRSSFTA